MKPDEIRNARKSLGLSQHGLADAMAMGKWGFQSIGKWERGEKPMPAHYALIVKMLLQKARNTDNNTDKADD